MQGCEGSHAENHGEHSTSNEKCRSLRGPNHFPSSVSKDDAKDDRIETAWTSYGTGKEEFEISTVCTTGYKDQNTINKK